MLGGSAERVAVSQAAIGRVVSVIVEAGPSEADVDDGPGRDGEVTVETGQEGDESRQEETRPDRDIAVGTGRGGDVIVTTPSRAVRDGRDREPGRDGLICELSTG